MEQSNTTKFLCRQPFVRNFCIGFHDDPCSGHMGINRTQEKLQIYAYWPGWRKAVEDYVNRCDTCCRYKRGPKFKQGRLQSAPSLAPMQKFHIDLTGPHPRSRKGNVYLLTGICSFTKYLITVPIRYKTAMSVARSLVERVYLIHGAVELQIHDQGTEFCNEVMRNLTSLIGIQELRTTCYKPSSNGSIERAHGTINAIFAKMVNSDLKNWDAMAPYVTFAYNNSKHTSTTFTPFYLTYMREARVSLNLLLDLGVSTYRSTDEYANLVKVRMNKAYEIVAARQKMVFERAKKRYDARVKAASFDVGDYVYYFSPKMAPGRGRKFQNLQLDHGKSKRRLIP